MRILVFKRAYIKYIVTLYMNCMVKEETNLMSQAHKESLFKAVHVWAFLTYTMSCF